MTSTALKTLWIAVLVIIFDHITKYLAVTQLTFGEPVAVFDHLNWTLAYNYGAAFSFLAEMGGWQRWFFVVLAFGMVAFMLWWLKKLPSKITSEVLAINLVIGGAIGNVIDRILAGRVTDFIDFYIGTWHYATFNIADVAITVGAVLLVFSELFLKKEEEEAAEKSAKDVKNTSN